MWNNLGSIRNQISTRIHHLINSSGKNSQEIWLHCGGVNVEVFPVDSQVPTILEAPMKSMSLE